MMSSKPNIRAFLKEELQALAVHAKRGNGPFTSREIADELERRALSSSKHTELDWLLGAEKAEPSRGCHAVRRESTLKL